MWHRILAALKHWFAQLTGGPKSPRDQLQDWIAELQEPIPSLDQAIARLRGETIRREGLVRKIDLQLQQLDRDIRESLQRGEREHAAALVTEKQQLERRRPDRQQAVAQAKADHARALALRQRYLEEVTARIREINELLRQQDAARWQARVAEVTQTLQTTGAKTLADQVMEEVQRKTDQDVARMRVEADLQTL